MGLDVVDYQLCPLDAPPDWTTFWTRECGSVLDELRDFWRPSSFLELALAHHLWPQFGLAIQSNCRLRSERVDARDTHGDEVIEWRHE